MKHIINNQKSIGKSIPAYGFKKISRKKSVNQKYRDFCQMFVIYKKKFIPQGMDLKIYRLAYGFLFFVISISGCHQYDYIIPISLLSIQIRSDAAHVLSLSRLASFTSTQTRTFHQKSLKIPAEALLCLGNPDPDKSFQIRNTAGVLDQQLIIHVKQSANILKKCRDNAKQITVTGNFMQIFLQEIT